jgi:hypothetical protein
MNWWGMTMGWMLDGVVGYPMIRRGFSGFWTICGVGANTKFASSSSGKQVPTHTSNLNQ